MAGGVSGFLKGLFRSTGRPSRYETFAKLDEGRMSVLYKALDKETMRPCLIKVYKHDCLRIMRAIRRKQPDMDSVLLSLDHPNVMRTYAFWLERGSECAAIEFIEGRSLGELARDPGVSLADLVRVFAGAAAGLAYIHSEKRLVHRDLNPTNIMVTRDLVPKIVDLDFSLVEVPDTMGMFRRSGTVAYLSPEQVRGRHVDRRVDIYSFGVTMYEVLTGVNPYADRTEPTEQERIDRTTYNHLVMIPEPPSTLRQDVPPGLDALVLECLQIDCEKRIQSAAEVASRLRDVAERL